MIKNSGYFIDEFWTITNFKFRMIKIPGHFPDIFWTFKKFWTFFLGKFQMIKNSGHFSRQIPDNQTFRKLVFILNPAISGQFPDIFWMHPDIFRYNFRTFLFYRASSALSENSISKLPFL